MAASRAELFLAVIAGGTGTRSGRRARRKRPKQLVSFHGDDEDGGPSNTLLAQTFDRFNGLVPKENRMVVTTQALAQAVAETVSGTYDPRGAPGGLTRLLACTGRPARSP